MKLEIESQDAFTICLAINKPLARQKWRLNEQTEKKILCGALEEPYT
jgi:hypothetical protein